VQAISIVALRSPFPGLAARSRRFGMGDTSRDIQRGDAAMSRQDAGGVLMRS